MNEVIIMNHIVEVKVIYERIDDIPVLWGKMDL